MGQLDRLSLFNSAVRVEGEKRAGVTEVDCCMRRRHWLHCQHLGIRLGESTCRAVAKIGVSFILACSLLLRWRKDKGTGCVCSICCDLKRCPLRNAVGWKSAAGSKKAMFWFSLWRQTGKIIRIKDIPPVPLPTAVLMLEGY